MQQRFTFPITLTPDEVDGGFIVTCRDLPEAITQGESIPECLEEAEGALEAALNSRMYRNAVIPDPSSSLAGEHLVSVPLDTAVKAALYLAMREQGVSKSELARRLHIDEKEARRIVNPSHGTRTATMDKALRAVGLKPALVLM